MAKLYFRYGAMGSSKTANALMVRHNYAEKGQTAILLKPQKENRDGEKVIRSRIGLEAECMFVEDFLKEFDKLINSKRIDAVIVDEAQFLTVEQVESLSDIVDFCDIPVICYGLRTDFTGHFFDGSRRLMELADIIEEVPTVCWCGKRAQLNARIINGRMTREGEQFMLGGNESYVSVCRRHYKEGIITEP